MKGMAVGPERYANLAYERDGGVYAIACLDSRGTLRKSVDTEDLAVLSRLGPRGMRLEIEVLLAADVEVAADAVRALRE